MNDNDNNNNVHLSIVAPAFNEAENLPQLVDESAQAGRAVGKSWEIIIANDDSDDETSKVLDRLRAEVPQLRVLDMQKRSGQTAALDAALRAARGKYIATLDADLQNDPADIPRLLKLIEFAQCDYVNGWRKDRKDQGWRLIVSKYGNAFRNRVTRETIHDSGCGLKVFRRECISRMKLFNGGHRFFVSLVRMEGYRVMEAEVHHRPRTAGVAKYGFLDRFFKVIRDAFAIRWMQNKIVLWEAKER
ncbi:MAG: glycosyltransferase [Phycisphaerae bacterium]|nr:glycosyltransferase [Phycisphaerae bacterium]